MSVGCAHRRKVSGEVGDAVSKSPLPAKQPVLFFIPVVRAVRQNPFAEIKIYISFIYNPII
jgi:hypothetical protein